MMRCKILIPLGSIKFKNMEQLKEYLQELQNEGIIHNDVNEHIMFLVKKLLSE